MKNNKLFFAFFLMAFFFSCKLFCQNLIVDSKNYANIQILNGVIDCNISVYLSGNLTFPNQATGARISSFGVSSEKLKIKIQKDNSEFFVEKELSLSKNEFHTLVLTGNFTELLSQPDTDPSTAKQYNLNFYLLNNSKPDSNSVSVRIVNGSSNKILSIYRDKMLQVKVSPGQVGIAQNQPVSLFMQATAQTSSPLDLYISQEPPPSNITVVFFGSENLGFKAMLEKSKSE